MIVSERGVIPSIGNPQHLCAAVCGATALTAGVAVIGLSTEKIQLGADATARLPMADWKVAAMALTLMVVVPMALAATRQLLGNRRAALSTVVAGILLVAWILTQALVFDQFGWIQFVCIPEGTVLITFGFRSFPQFVN